MQSIKKYCNSVESVNLSRNKITSKGIIILFDGLVGMEKVRVIDVSGNDISDDCMESIANFIKKSQVIDLSINLSGFYPLIVAFGGNPNKRPTKSKNVTNKSIEILHSVLIGNTNVKVINLNYQGGIADECVPLLKEIAEQSGASLFLAWAPISDENSKELKKLFGVPIENRSIPVISNTKSASKSNQIS